MTVTLIRHGKVLHTWKKSCTSAEFDEECRKYDEAPIEDMARIKNADATKVYISTLPRSFQTAKMLFGEREFYRTDLINEVPLSSAFDFGKRLPLWVWCAAGRTQWLFNSKMPRETKRDTIKRAENFVKEIAANGGDCFVVTHGFFMQTLIAVMKKHGFTPDKTSVHYRNGQAVVLIK